MLTLKTDFLSIQFDEEYRQSYKNKWSIVSYSFWCIELRGDIWFFEKNFFQLKLKIEVGKPNCTWIFSYFPSTQDS